MRGKGEKGGERDFPEGRENHRKPPPPPHRERVDQRLGPIPARRPPAAPVPGLVVVWEEEEMRGEPRGRSRPILILILILIRLFFKPRGGCSAGDPLPGAHGHQP